MKLKKAYYLLSAFVLFFTGCIAEDVSDCLPDYNLQLQFVYTGDGERDIFLEKIEQVEVYVFDEQGKFIQTFHIGLSSLKRYQGLQVNLPMGKYTFVCWGNINENMQIPSLSSGYKENYQVNPTYTQDGVLRNADPMYYGIAHVMVSEFPKVTEFVSFVSAHINFEIYIEGADIQKGEDGEVLSPSLVFKELNSSYDFDMNTIGERAEYHPLLKLYDKKEMVYSTLDVLRFGDNNTIVVDVIDKQGNSLHSFALEQFMRENDIHVEGLQEVTIPIYIKFQGIDVNVSLPHWDDQEVKPDF